MMIARMGTIAAVSALVAACAEGPRPESPGQTNTGTMRPYQVGGVWYRPAYQPHYEETGLASWYGPQAHYRTTADGEVFDQRIASAAHRTLPLPCLVEVTNLDNGRQARLRVNDRGPFVAGRILDVSRRGAEELGFAGQGIARVRVRYLGPAPGAVHAPEAQPAPEPQQSPAGARVQAGAFASRDNAEQAARRLWPRGEVAIIAATSRERTLWRVIVTGPEGETGEALRGAIVAQGFTDARLLTP